MIHIITTGGTIEGVDHDPQEDNTHEKIISIEHFFRSANVSFPYSIENVLNKDSRFITDEDRELLVKKIKASDTAKIVLTHGTFTMEDTAKYIGKLNLNKTIVLVGSFVLGSSYGTDAPFNLGYAICSVPFLIPDVYVAMNGTIFNWKNVTKNLETNKFEQL
ncbi:asparaginase domain-containing protein [Salegentibacter sp. F188]|uniref:Asparaginase domain-containing protein n=1 Tax=Autumnicola patrickiae TaxID=3075591 RepID=A0ABU3E730_9FLAO|nr:asparaginase domain-containing protein [Salegentibacter sp. F188]MDT0691770.1 asparaginase domain-containing protein [Salegentibacter sp. F188]